MDRDPRIEPKAGDVVSTPTGDWTVKSVQPVRRGRVVKTKHSVYGDGIAPMGVTDWRRMMRKSEIKKVAE